MGLYIASIEEVLLAESEGPTDSLELFGSFNVEITETGDASDSATGLHEEITETGDASDEVVALNLNGSITEIGDGSDAVSPVLTLNITQQFIVRLDSDHLYISQQEVFSLTAPIYLIKNFHRSFLHLEQNIYQQVELAPQNLRMHLLENSGPPVSFSAPVMFSLLESDHGTTTVKIEYKVLLDGIDVTDLVVACSINFSVGNFTSDVDVTWAHMSLTKTRGDLSLYNLLDCSNIALNYAVERLEVYTRVATNDNPEWVLQGRFFLEKRGTTTDYSGSAVTSWGRNRTARLTMPYALPLTKVWAETTTAYSIAKELCDTAGVTLSWEIADYRVLGSNVSVDGEEPISIISALAAVLGATLTTDKDGRLRVLYRYFT